MQYSLILKAKEKKSKVDEKRCAGLRAKNFIATQKKLNFGAEKSSEVLRNARRSRYFRVRPLLSGINRKVGKLTLLSGSRYF